MDVGIRAKSLSQKKILDEPSPWIFRFWMMFFLLWVFLVSGIATDHGIVQFVEATRYQKILEIEILEKETKLKNLENEVKNLKTDPKAMELAVRKNLSYLKDDETLLEF